MKNSVSWFQMLIFHFYKRFGMILLLCSLVLGVVGAVGYKASKAPEYVSTGQLVQNDNNYNIISAYSQFVQTGRFKDALKEATEKSKWSNSNLKYSVAITNNSNSPFFNVSVTSSNANYSNFIANQSMKILVANIGKYLSGSNISILTQARSKNKSISLSRIALVGMVVAFIMFLVLSLIVVVNSWIVGSVKKERYIEEVTGLKNFGVLKLKKTR